MKAKLLKEIRKNIGLFKRNREYIVDSFGSLQKTRNKADALRWYRLEVLLYARALFKKRGKGYKERVR